MMQNVKPHSDGGLSKALEDAANLKHKALANRLYLDCVNKLEAGRLKLPTIPEIAIKIRRAINDSNTNNAKIAKIVQLDPAISARLIHISNSPLYRGRKKIESCPQALTRIGLKAAQDLITSFALKSVFKAKSPVIRKRMQDLWAHSSYVAAISAYLAHKTPGFDPDRALLAGLIHDIGAVPILIQADIIPGLNVPMQDLELTIQHLRTEIGVMIIRKWDFPKDFEEVILHAEDWYHNSKPEPDYTDIVIISQLHSYIGSREILKFPRMDTLPAYKKLVSGQLDADLSKNILDTAKDEIWQIQRMLSV